MLQRFPLDGADSVRILPPLELAIFVGGPGPDCGGLRHLDPSLALWSLLDCLFLLGGFLQFWLNWLN